MSKPNENEKLPFSPEDTEKEKLRLIGLVKSELKIHGLVDLTAFVKDHASIDETHIHSGFVRSMAFKMEKLGIVEVIPVEGWQRFYIKELTWTKKHPFLHSMRVSFANSFFYVIAGVLIAFIGSKVTNLDGNSSTVERIVKPQQNDDPQIEQSGFNYTENFERFLTRFNQDSAFQLSRIRFPHEQEIIDPHEGGEGFLIYEDSTDWIMHLNLEYKDEFHDGINLEYEQDTIWANSTVTIQQRGDFSMPQSKWHVDYVFSNIGGKWYLTSSKDLGY